MSGIAPRKRKRENAFAFSLFSGAAEESRTLDLNLGKVALYQLSYCRVIPGGASRSRTDLHGFAIRCITALLSRHDHLPMASYKQKKPKGFFIETGAAEESRTLDLNLGKVALYQLSYCRKSECALYRLRAACQRFASFLWLAAESTGTFPSWATRYGHAMRM